MIKERKKKERKNTSKTNGMFFSATSLRNLRAALHRSISIAGRTERAVRPHTLPVPTSKLGSAS